MRERLVVGNWKMHTNLADASILATRIRNGMHQVPSEVTTVICPPTVWLYPVAEILEPRAYELFEMLRDHLRQAGVFELCGAGTVLTGVPAATTAPTSAWTAVITPGASAVSAA